MNSIIEYLSTNLSDFLSGQVIVFIISLFPILELRGGLIASSPLLLDLPLLQALPICVIGNLLPIPFILLLITQIFILLKKTKFLGRFVRKIEAKAMAKKDQIEKYGFWGLVLFVGIPLPGTGAWTGALIAVLLGMNRWKAFGAILIGVVMASAIISVLFFQILGMYA